MNIYLGGLNMTQNLGCDVVQVKFHKAPSSTLHSYLLKNILKEDFSLSFKVHEVMISEEIQKKRIALFSIN